VPALVVGGVVGIYLGDKRVLVIGFDQWCRSACRWLRSVTMSQIAEQTGIGRATLYKYFADVDAILIAWHERHIRGHLEQRAALKGGSGSPRERLEAVLERYALIQYEHHDTGTRGSAASG